MSAPAEPNIEAVESFWTRAQTTARLNRFDVVMGPSQVTNLTPPAWSMGATAEQAHRLAELVLSGEKRATSSLAEEYAAWDEAIPAPGDLAILCDGAGMPVALIETTDVSLVPASEVTDEHKLAEGEGTVAEWDAEHDAFFRARAEESGVPWDPESLIVCETLRVLARADR